MAKRKRAAHEKPFARSMKNDSADADATIVEAANEEASPSVDLSSGDAASDTTANADEPNKADQPDEDQPNAVVAEFVGKWNQLISTTNWEKGEIICQWRDALMQSGAAVTEYSDEAWAQTVGGVTSQHVGRLRRVYQRFGDVWKQYEGLHWSHFQACLDWDDAEMWLEGSIQNGWSVSQMRGRRWETVDASPEQKQAEIDQLAAEQKSEADAEEEQAQAAAAEQDRQFDEASGPSATEIEPFGGTVAADDNASGSDAESAVSASTEPIEKRTRLNVDVESLPDDLAEAFESFKLAIIAHRRENWRDTTPASVVECLDALKQLALAEN